MIQFFATLLIAQSPYVSVQYPEPITPLSGGTLILGPGAFGDEARIIPIGFTFRFFDVDYTHVNVGENGLLYFANTCAQGCTFNESCNAQNQCETRWIPPEFNGMPNFSEPNRVIAAFWDDLYIDSPAPASEIRYGIRGGAPNRELVVEWRNLRHLPFIFAPDTRMSFQIRLEEGSNTIRLHYGAYTPGQSNIEWSGIIGIENQQGTEAVFPLACGTNGSCSWIDLNMLNNNVLQISIPNAPELGGTVSAPRGGAPGSPASFPVTVRNIGLQPTAGGFSSQVYLSSDQTITPGVDTLLGTVNHGVLGAGQSTTATLSISIPSITQAYYYVGALIDSADVIPEPVETNNSAVANRLFLVGRDLSVAFGAHPGLPPGQMADVMFDLLNESSTQPNVLWRVYLSTDTIRDAGDSLLASGTVTAPASSTTQIVSNVLVPPLVPGTYRLIAVVDPNNTVVEIDEFDNEVSSGPVLLGPDLSIFEIGAPTTSGSGATIPLSVGVLNEGSPVAIAQIEVSISQDSFWDPSDPVVFTGTVAAPFGQQYVDVTGLVPTFLNTGDYYLVARMDPNDLIDEVDDLDNIYQSFDAIRLIGPDLAAVGVEVDDPAFHGQPFRLRGTVDNQGGSPINGFYVSFLLSENELITISDPLLLELGPFNLEPNDTMMVDETIIFDPSIAAGEYFIGFVADSRDAFPEEREINNIRRTPSRIVVRGIAPDIVSSEIIVPATAGSGESFYVQRVLENQGNAMGMVDYLVFLVIDGTNVRVAVIGGGSVALGAGEVDEGADLVTVPADVLPGDYRVEYVMDPEELLEELEEENNSKMSVGIVSLQPAQLTIVSGTPTLAVLGVDYEFDFVARGGTGPITWSVTQGALPVGLSLDTTTGRVSGVATTEGVSTFGLRASDGALYHERAFAIRVVPPTTALRIVSRAIPPGFVQTPYDFPLVAIGGVEPYSWSVSPKLPEGFALTGDGRVAGTTSTVAPALVYTFGVVDAAGAKDDTLIAFRVLARDRSVRFDQVALGDGIVGEQYDSELVAVGGIPPYTFALASGALPAGLTIANGRLAGVPTEAGEFVFELSVTDDAKDQDRNFYVVYIEPADRVRFVTTSLPPGKVGVAYADADGTTVQVRAITPGGTGDVTYSLFSGMLPPGLSFAADGSITGSPTMDGVYAFILAANDPIGEVDFRAFGIVVEAPPPTMPEDDGCGCTAAEDRAQRGGRGEAPTSGQRAGRGWIWLLIALPLIFRKRGAWLALLLVVMPQLAQAQGFDAGPPPPPPPLDGGGPGGPDGGVGPDGGGPGVSTPYFISEYEEAYTVRSGGTSLFPSNVDDGQATIPLPFPFRFFDTFYSSLEAGTNGYVTFDFEGSSLGNTPIPDSQPFSPHNLIALYWDDLISPSMSLHFEGVQPNRIAIIQWEGTYTFGGPGTERMSMQLWLYEGLAGRFELHFGPMMGVQNVFYDATIGFENQTGTEGYSLRSCNPVCGSNDLVALEGIVIRALQDAGEDVFATDIAPVDLTEPIRAYGGVPFDVRSRVTSYHTDPLGPFQYSVHLVDPTSGQPIVPAVFTSTAITLGPYEDRELIDSISLPLATTPGRYSLALMVDSSEVLSEPNEDNNVIFSRQQVLVGERKPDFTVVSVTPSQPTALPGETLDVDVELRNAGNLDGASAWRVVLSGNASPSVDDVIGATSTTDQMLMIGTTVMINTTIDIPADLTPGLYYVGVLVDPTNTVSELLEVNNDAASETQVQIGQGTLEIRTQSLPVAYLGLEYSATLSASGATGQYSWSVVGGMLPPGIALLAETGDFDGIPTEAGTFSVTLRATSGTASTEATFELVVAPIDGPLTIVTRRLLPGLVGLDYPPSTEEEQRLVAVGGAGPATFTTTSSLPPGLVLDSDGYLHGEPSAPGDFYLEIQASDGTNTATREIPLTIAEPGRLTVIGERLPSATFADLYGYQLAVTGDNPVDPPIFTVIAGELPEGLMLSGQGAISGAPEQAGEFAFNVEVREAASGAKDTATFYLTVTTDEGLTIDPGSLPVATLNEPYEVVLTAQGGMEPVRWVVDYSQDLPRGLMEERVEIDGAMRFRIFGAPEEIPESGVVGILVKAEDAAGRSRKAAYALSVREPAPAAQPEDDGCGCTAAGHDARGGGWLIVILLLGSSLRMRSWRWALPLLLTGACDCGDGGTLTELQPKLTAPERIDFGDVGIGIEAEQIFVMKNEGNGTLKIESKTIEASLEDFRIISVIPTSIEANQSVEVRLGFTPIQLGESTATLTIVADDMKGTHTIALVGKGVVPGIAVEFAAPPCDGASGSLSFGTVAPGSIATVPLTLRAVGSQAVLVTASRVSENATNEFSLEAVAEGTSIAPGQSLELAATYQPADAGPDTAAFIIETDAPGSRAVRVPACGRGATPVLCADPLDLGRVAVGSLATGTMVVRNCSTDPVEVTGISMSTNPASDIGYAIGSLSRTPPVTLQAEENIQVEVRLTANLIGMKGGWVHVTSSSPQQPNVFFPVKADVADTCGLDIVPSRLVFPSVLVGASDRRNVLLANAGSDPCAITRVEITSGGSVYSLRDPFATPRSLDPGFSDLLVVRYQPTLPGATDVGVLEVQAGTRVHRVDLIGNPPQSPGCQLDITPDYINYGTVPAGQTVIRQVEIENIGLDACSIGGAEFDASTDEAFTRVATQIGALPAGSETTAIVTFRAPPSGTATGLLRIDTTDVETPLFEIGLFGATAAPGICVLPRDLDFGMTMNGTETFRIWACGAEAVTLTDLTFTRPDDEFTFDAPPALPAILQPNEERTITVHYTSIDDVGDSAVITVGSNDPADPLIRVNVTAGPVIVPPTAGRYLYYWQIDGFGGNASNIIRMPLQGAPVPEPFWGPLNGKPCSGCHGVSPDGRYVSLIEETNFAMQIIDTQTNLQVALPFQALSTAYVSWRPDPNTTPPYQFAYDENDRIHIASVTDGYIGELNGANDPAYGSKMPSWGSNGMIAFARGGPGGGWGFWGPSDIMLVDEAGGVAVPVMGASGLSSANYYPAYHPNGNWIAYTESLAAQGTISAPDGRVKLVATDQSGTVLDLPLVNCAIGACGSSFPTWSVDGEFLSFSSNRAGGAGGWDMYISDIDPITGDAMPPFNIVEANTPSFEHAARWSD